MRGEQAIFNLEIKKKSGLSINPDIRHSKVFSSVLLTVLYYELSSNVDSPVLMTVLYYLLLCTFNCPVL